MRKKFFAMAAAAMFLLASLVSAAEIQNGGYIEVEGFKSNEPGRSVDELRRMAILDAYRMLAEAVGDLKITSHSKMSDLVRLDDEVEVSVQKTVRGAKVSPPVRDSEGNFHATARLNIYGGVNSIANAVVPKNVQQQPFPKPMVMNIDSNYTGLIVDCSGQNISTAVLPVIKTASQQEIYAFKYLDRNIVVNRGMVNYSDNASSGVQRAGSNPLTVQAMFIEGECDVVVSDEDAQKILAANQKSDFLKNCMVVFVK